MLEIRLFGTMQVTLDGAPARAYESDKVRALLVYLVVEAGRSHRREALAELLWPENSERRARRNLSQALYSLRQTLQAHQSSVPPYLLLTPETLQLNPAFDIWLDVAEFTRLVEACDRHAHPSRSTCMPCQERLQQAVSLYGGDFLGDFSIPDSAAFDQWCLVARERYRLLARGALSNLASIHEQEGRAQPALEYARRLAELDPLDDSACQQLMRLLVSCGKRGDALSHYESFRSTLRADLNITPQAETTALYERIRLQLEVGPTPAARRHNLPASLSPLIGREAELAELQARLLDPSCRLLTVLGPGGLGKSRLALEAARGLLDCFADGVFLVPLSPLISPVAFLPSVAEALGLPIKPPKPPLTQVQDYLRQKELLLLLDGCEGLLEGVPLMLELMRAAPGLKVLATSRTRLNTEEEQVYLLGGLDYPASADPEGAAHSAAVRLFASGARRVRPTFELDPQVLPAVSEICADAQGMPLAILLAAAWAEVLSPAEILEEMRTNLDFLQAEWAGLPIRQRSMRLTFDYSWKLLEESEQAVFQALCNFRGGFTRQAAQAVSGASPAQIRRLVDKSFLMPQPGEWYAIHALLRQFGLEKLNGKPAASLEAHRRYSAYYLEKLENWEAGLKGARQQETLAAMDAKINDVSPAWEWAVGQHEIEGLSRALEGLGLYYELRTRFQEGQSACQVTAHALAELDAPEALHLRARLLAWEARFSRLLGERELGRQRLELSQALVDELAASRLDTQEVQALIHLEAGEAVFMADLAEANRRLGLSLALYRQIGDTWRIAGVLTQMGVNRFHASDYLEADKLFTDALELYQDLGATLAVANVQGRMAHNQSRLGKIESGLALLREVAAFTQASGDRSQAMLDLRTLGLALMWNGLWEDAYPVFQNALSLARDLGNRYETAFISLCLGLDTQFMAQYELSREHHARTLELARGDNFQREIACSLFSLGCITIVQKTPQEARPIFRESIAVYRQIGDLDEMGWSLSLDAYCCLENGDSQQARHSLVEALEIAHSRHAYFTSVIALPVGALWLERHGELEKALETYTIAFQQPLLANSNWYHDMFDKCVAACAAGLPAEIAAAARERGKGRQLFAAVDELAKIITASG